MDPFLPCFWTHRPFLARNRHFLDIQTPSCPIFDAPTISCPGTVPFWTYRSLSACNHPFLDTWTPSCPVFGCTDHFSHPNCPFLDVQTFSCPVFGCVDHFAPRIVPFWTYDWMC